FVVEWRCGSKGCTLRGRKGFARTVLDAAAIVVLRDGVQRFEIREVTVVPGRRGLAVEFAARFGRETLEQRLAYGGVHESRASIEQLDQRGVACFDEGELYVLDADVEHLRDRVGHEQWCDQRERRQDGTRQRRKSGQ